MARVEGYGVEPVPAELRTGTWRDLFAINLAFFLNPLMYVVGALAVSSAKRTPLAPGLPTIAESGVPGYENTAMNAVFAPAGTPRPLVMKLNQTLLRWIQSPETKERFFNSGADVWPTTPEELGQIVKADMAKWAKVIKERGIRASD